MKERPNNPLDDGWNPDDFVVDSGSDEASNIDLWQIESSPDDFGSPEYAPVGFDAPEPEDEFDGGLSQDPHPPDEGIQNLRQTLELDEFLAYVDEMTDCQRYSIEEALLNFSASKRANWLRWLKSKKWNGKTLLLFLLFHHLWNETSIWWECIYSSASSGVREPYSNNAALTREMCYDLVLLRLDYRLEKVIDERQRQVHIQGADYQQSGSPAFGFGAGVRHAVAGVPEARLRGGGRGRRNRTRDWVCHDHISKARLIQHRRHRTVAGAPAGSVERRIRGRQRIA